MSLETNQVSCNAVAAPFVLAAKPPVAYQGSHEIVEELLSHLRQRRSTRQEEFSAFFAKEYAPALEFAWRITRSRSIAERAVSLTLVEVLERRTSPPFFFHALKLNARNELARRKRERARATSLDALSQENATVAGDDSTPESAGFDFASSRIDDQDPLEILIWQGDQTARKSLIGKARKRVLEGGEFWEMRQSKWWKDFINSEKVLEKTTRKKVGCRE